jgi:hypothetical protein
MGNILKRVQKREETKRALIGSLEVSESYMYDSDMEADTKSTKCNREDIEYLEFENERWSEEEVYLSELSESKEG